MFNTYPLLLKTHGPESLKPLYIFRVKRLRQRGKVHRPMQHLLQLTVAGNTTVTSKHF
jgi:hypothetical protein